MEDSRSLPKFVACWLGYILVVTRNVGSGCMMLHCLLELKGARPLIYGKGREGKMEVSR